LPADYRDLTPELAQEFLDTLAVPKFDEQRVEVYAKRMLAGQFKTSTIVLSHNGKQLLDGRHRCRAVILSGVSIRVLVMRDLHDLHAF
jgi:ParB-like chromosome segregation protein Spo0J